MLNNYAEPPLVFYNSKRLGEHSISELADAEASVCGEIIDLQLELEDATYQARRSELNILIGQQERLLESIRIVRENKGTCDTVFHYNPTPSPCDCNQVKASEVL